MAIGARAEAAPAARPAPETRQPAPAEPEPATPPVDTRRVTGNVVLGPGKGPGDTCRLDEGREVPLAEATVDPEHPERCTVEIPMPEQR